MLLLRSHGRERNRRPVNLCERSWSNPLQPSILRLWRVVLRRPRKAFTRWRARQLLNNTSKVVLAYVIHLRLRLRPCGGGGGGISVSVSVRGETRLVQRALSDILPNLIHTQMIVLSRPIHLRQIIQFCFYSQNLTTNPENIQQTQTPNMIEELSISRPKPKTFRS